MDPRVCPLFAPGDPSSGVTRDQLLTVAELGLLGVADAPAGGEHGRAGARIALDNVRNHFERHRDILQRFARHPSSELRGRILEVMEESFGRAAQEVYAYARRRRGLLITLDVLLFAGTEVFVGHVGDGRVYLVRKGLTHQLTVDHSRADEALIVDWEEAPGEAMPSNERRFTRALGAEPRVRAESLCMEAAPNDRFLVTTGHLAEGLPGPDLHRLLPVGTVEEAAQRVLSAVGARQVVGVLAEIPGGAKGGDDARRRLALLRPMPLFKHCGDEELRAVAAATHPHTYPAGAVIFSQGDPGTEIYLLISGKVRVEREGQVLATLGPGSNFGEMAMLDEPVRSATLVAVEEAEVFIIGRAAFFKLLQGDSKIAVKVLWNMLLGLSAHLRKASERLAEGEGEGR